jgi:cupin 2 domain-containing protein
VSRLSGGGALIEADEEGPREGAVMVKIKVENLANGLPARALAKDVTETLCERPGVRIERIVSTGQATPEGEWYDQEVDEWVLLVKGSARLRIEGEANARKLSEGDFVFLPAHCRHRVAWTQREPPTVWLAIHIFTNC